MRLHFGDLHQVLQKVAPTLPSKDGGIEVLTRICFSDGKVTTFNGRTGTIATHGLALQEEFCIPGKKFLSVIAAVKDSTGTLTFANGWVFIRAGEFQTQVPYLPTSDYPDFKLTGREKVVADNPTWQEALKRALVFATTDESAESVMGVGIMGGFAYSTDRKRIMKAALGQEVQRDLVLTPHAAEQIVRLGDPNQVLLGTSRAWYLYKEAETMVVSLLPAQPFPFEAIAPVFNMCGGSQVSIPETLRGAVERVSSFSEDDEGVLTWAANGTFLTIETEADQAGSAKESVPLESKPFRIKLKGNALKVVLRNLKPDLLDYTDLDSGNGRMVAFVGDGWVCVFAGMV